MGMLIDGKWTTGGQAPATSDGRFVRAESKFRNWITADGAPEDGGFKAEPGRYRLYVSYACPWAHRALTLRALKQLENHIPVSVVHWHMGDQGWTFEPGEGVVPDPQGHEYLHQVYTQADPGFTGRVSVPVLWDSARHTIVNNESSEIIRMLNSAFELCGAAPGDYYPLALRPEIDAVNARVYATLNNGVYRAGFATSQGAYEEAVRPLFETLDWLEARLGGLRYVCGPRVTEADWRLLTTLLRFDPVYVGHFKCNLRRLIDYPNLWDYTRELYQWPGVRDTTDFQHIKRHYFGSHQSINPTGIVPVGPLLDFMAPHGRG